MSRKKTDIIFVKSPPDRESDGVHPSSPPLPDEDPESRPSPPHKVLIVDDEPQIIEILETALIHKGLDVHSAANGWEAVERLRHDAFDLIITDIQMPGIDGSELTRRAKSLDRHLEVIILTGYASFENAVSLMRNDGAFDYLAKPISVQDLYISVDQALEKRRLRRKNEAMLKNLKAEKLKIEVQNQELIKIRQNLTESKNTLEKAVEERTGELRKVNQKLHLEIAERIRTEEALQEALTESQKRGEEISALLKASRAVLEHKSFQETFQAIFQAFAEITEIEAGCVKTVNENGTDADCLFLGNLGPAFRTCVNRNRVSFDALENRVRRLGRTRYENHRTDIISHQSRKPPDDFIQNQLFSPLKLQGRPAGIMGMANKPGGFSDNDVRMAEAFGELTALAFHNSRTLESLENSEKRFRLVAQTASDAIISADADGKIVFWNRAAESIFGYPAEEMLGGFLSDVIAKPYQDLNRKFLRHVIATRRIETAEKQLYEIWGCRRNGQEFPMEFSLAAWRADQKIFITAIIRDVTIKKRKEETLNALNRELERRVDIRTKALQVKIREREQMEKQLRKSRERLRAVLDGISDPLVMFSRDLEVLMSNRAASDYRSSCKDIPLHADPFIAALEDFGVAEEGSGMEFLFEKQRPLTVERQGIQDFGRIEKVTVYPVRDGEDGGTLIVRISDITEVKRFQNQMMQSERLASIGELAAGVAHEINNPINGVINYAQILIDEAEENGESDDIPARILKEAERVARIVKNLLFFARASEEDSGPVHLKEVVADTLEMMGKKLEKDGIVLKTEFPDDLPPVHVNRHKIQQLLISLLSNSRDALNRRFTEKSAGKQIILTGRTASGKEGGRVRLTVFDQGTGIPKALINKVCNPFFSTKPTSEGTGLGLSISYGIVRECGGSLLIESAEGEFTQIHADFPRVGGTEA